MLGIVHDSLDSTEDDGVKRERKQERKQRERESSDSEGVHFPGVYVRGEG